MEERHLKTQLINDIAEQDYRRLLERFKQESIAEWDVIESMELLSFPVFLMVQVAKKFEDYARLN